MLNDLLRTCEFIAKRNLCPATAGNFSIREGDKMRMSASGKDKSELTTSDFVVCDLNGHLLSGEGKPSAEAALHGMIYQLSPHTHCVLHTHSVAVTVLSMLPDTDNKLIFKDYEMQKTISGFETHKSVLELMVFDNNQDIPLLAKQVKSNWDAVSKASGLIVRGHGLYSWGTSVFDAKRHMEGLEFLVECELQRQRLIK